MADVGALVLRPPEQDADFAPVNVDKALALVGHVGAHAAAHDAVPGRQVHLVELCFDDFGDVVQDAALLEGEGDAVHRVLLHVLVHVRELDDCILSLLLVSSAVRLHYLRVGLPLPLFGLHGPGVRCNLRD